MSTLDLFEKIRVSQIASSLDLHPFEVARLLGQVGGLPRTLAFDQEDIDRVRELAGVETWWLERVQDRGRRLGPCAGADCRADL